MEFEEVLRELQWTTPRQINFKQIMAFTARIIGNDSEAEMILNRHMCKRRSHFIEVTPKKIVLPGGCSQIYEHIKNFEVHDDDVFIFGFPKSGTRLIQEMVWLLLNNLDFKTATEVVSDFRVPLLEVEGYFDQAPSTLSRVSDIAAMKGPRCIKSHLHWDLWPEAIRTYSKQPKIIGVIREAEDVCTSYYYQNIAEEYSGTWEEFCYLFLEGKVPYGPYWEHVLGFWEQRHKPNVLLLKYNEIVNDLVGTVRNVAKFFGKTLTDDDVVTMGEYLKIDNLKKITTFNCDFVYKEGVNPLVRKGIVGDHKNVMSPEVIQEFQKKREQYFSGTDLFLE